jgi:hypothetical protein
MAAGGGNDVSVGPAALEAALARSLHHRRVRDIVVQELAPLLTVAATAPYEYDSLSVCSYSFFSLVISTYASYRERVT